MRWQDVRDVVDDNARVTAQKDNVAGIKMVSQALLEVVKPCRPSLCDADQRGRRDE